MANLNYNLQKNSNLFLNLLFKLKVDRLANNELAIDIKKYFLAFSFLTLAITLSSCGSSKSYDDSSVDSTQTETLDDNLNPIPQAKGKCSIDMSNNNNLGFKLKAYESTTEGLRSDLLRTQYIRFPSDFAADLNNSLVLWTRTIDSAGNWGQWQQVSFYIEHLGQGGGKSPYSYNEFTFQQMQDYGKVFNMTITSASQFFSSFQIVAQLDAQGNSKIITSKIYYNQSTDQNSGPEATALAPLFDANPISYKGSHPESLYNLHPLQSLIGYSYTNSQFEYELNRYCF